MQIRHEPVAIAAAVQAVLGFAIIMGWIHMTAEQTGSAIIALNAVLAIIVRQNVTPNTLAEDRVAIGLSPTQKVPEVMKDAMAEQQQKRADNDAMKDGPHA